MSKNEGFYAYRDLATVVYWTVEYSFFVQLPPNTLADWRRTDIHKLGNGHSIANQELFE